MHIDHVLDAMVIVIVRGRSYRAAAAKAKQAAQNFMALITLLFYMRILRNNDALVPSVALFTGTGV